MGLVHGAIPRLRPRFIRHIVQRQIPAHLARRLESRNGQEFVRRREEHVLRRHRDDAQHVRQRHRRRILGFARTADVRHGQLGDERLRRRPKRRAAVRVEAPPHRGKRPRGPRPGQVPRGIHHRKLPERTLAGNAFQGRLRQPFRLSRHRQGPDVPRAPMRGAHADDRRHRTVFPDGADFHKNEVRTGRREIRHAAREELRRNRGLRKGLQGRSRRLLHAGRPQGRFPGRKGQGAFRLPVRAQRRGRRPVQLFDRRQILAVPIQRGHGA